MMERRRLLEMDTGYIKSGLVLWLDGIDRGGISGEWHSLIGDSYATLYDSYTELSDGIYFPDSTPNGYGIVTNPIGINYATGTIEVCAEMLYNDGIARPTYCHANSNIGGSVMLTTSYTINFRFWCRTGSTTPGWYVTLPNPTLKVTVSGNLSYGIGNGLPMISQTFSSWGQASGTTFIARRANSGVPFLGTLHAIRIYNRLLTASEMLHNQKIDNKRYNLGLNI